MRKTLHKYMYKKGYQYNYFVNICINCIYCKMKFFVVFPNIRYLILPIFVYLLAVHNLYLAF